VVSGTQDAGCGRLAATGDCGQGRAGGWRNRRTDFLATVQVGITVWWACWQARSAARPSPRKSPRPAACSHARGVNGAANHANSCASEPSGAGCMKKLFHRAHRRDDALDWPGGCWSCLGRGCPMIAAALAVLATEIPVARRAWRKGQGHSCPAFDANRACAIGCAAPGHA